MQTTEVTAAPPSRELLIWAWVGAALAVALFWAVMMEAGSLSAVDQIGPFVHELFHDGRHLLGVPCH